MKVTTNNPRTMVGTLKCNPTISAPLRERRERMEKGIGWWEEEEGGREGVSE